MEDKYKDLIPDEFELGPPLTYEELYELFFEEAKYLSEHPEADIKTEVSEDE